jgi:hypothetical protein
MHAPPPGWDGVAPATRRLGRAALGSVALSIALMVAVGAAGPSVVVPRFRSQPPWPPYFAASRPASAAVAGLAWLAVALGGLGVAAALVAARRGWRPRPQRLLIGGLLAVIALLLMPPLASTDMLDYAVYGRIAALGRSPYQMTPGQLLEAGDPVGAVAPYAWRNKPSVYGPLATLSEQAASELAGPSAARTVFWLKVWNALAFLAVALALDRLLRSDPAARIRAHLLWSVNPLMLWAVLAGGHVDGLGTALGFCGLLCLRRLGIARGAAAGLLIGAAIAVKAPFALFLPGLAWAARRSPRTLIAGAAGVAGAVVPGYLSYGLPAINALVARARGGPDLYEPWQLVTRLAGIQSVTSFDDTAALIASCVLVLILLWRLPSGLPGLPFARPALAFSLAWLVFTPQQRPWYDAMIFPLLAVMPATRLDWILLFRAAAAAMAEIPGARFYTGLRPHWLLELGNVISRDLAPVAMALAAAALLWLCITGRWGPGGRDQGQPLPEVSASGALS